MAIDRHLWRTSFSDTIVPKYPCPKCGKGSLIWDKDRYVNLEPTYSKREHSDENWSPDWVTSRFVGLSICANAMCGEVVAIAGSSYVDHQYVYSAEGEQDLDGWQTMLKPASMTPAPHLFPLSQKIPDAIRKEITLAFQLYWADLGAATARLRTSLEMVLDDRGVPRKSDKLNLKGKGILNLEQRILKFAATAGDAESAEAMEALRVVGNIGTHGETIYDKDFFDLLDVYEHALLEIYEQLSAKRKAKRARLIALKDK